jgi:hypothetical protein
MDLWISGKASECNDYAIILRRTFLTNDGNRHVRFVLAGFTEKSTAIAGKYLADRWRFLWQDYVAGKTTPEHGYGDFFLVIAGKSNTDKACDWSKAFEAITPNDSHFAGMEDAWPHPSI